MSGSYPYAGKCATVYKYSTVHGISQGKKHVDDIRQACELKIQVREQKFLVPRVLCRYGHISLWTLFPKRVKFCTLTQKVLLRSFLHQIL